VETQQAETEQLAEQLTEQLALANKQSEEMKQLQQQVDASEAVGRQLQQQLTSGASLQELKVLKQKLAEAEDEAANAK